MPIRVLQVGKFYYPIRGGIELVLRNMCEELREDFEIQVIVANTTTHTCNDIVNGVQICRVSNWGEILSNSLCPTFPFQLRKYLQVFKPDIVHLHLPNPTAHLSYLLSKYEGKLVITWHSDIARPLPRSFLKFYNLLLSALLNRADAIIATSPNLVKSSIFLSRYTSKVHAIPLGIDVRRFDRTPGIEKRLISLADKFGHRIVLFVGRLVYYKGIEYLIRSFKHVEAKLIIIGDGPLRSSLGALVAKLGLSDKVTFLYEVSDDDLVTYYHLCDIFVLPSIAKAEGFGLVQVEAMACEKAVVSTDLEGLPFVNQHNQTGIIVPMRDVNALTIAINHLLDHPEIRIRYGLQAQARVIQEFTKQKMGERIKHLYESML